MIQFLVLLLAAAAVAAVLQDAFEVMLLPRRIARRWRFVSLYFKATWWV